MLLTAAWVASAVACRPSAGDATGTRRPPGTRFEWGAAVFGERIANEEILSLSSKRLATEGDEVDRSEILLHIFAGQIRLIALEHFLAKHKIKVADSEVAAEAIAFARRLGIDDAMLADMVSGERASAEFAIEFRSGRIAADEAAAWLCSRTLETASPNLADRIRDECADNAFGRELVEHALTNFPTAEDARRHLERIKPGSHYYGYQALISLQWGYVLRAEFGTDVLAAGASEVVEYRAEYERDRQLAVSSELAAYRISNGKALLGQRRLLLDAVENGSIQFDDPRVRKLYFSLHRNGLPGGSPDP